DLLRRFSPVPRPHHVRRLHLHCMLYDHAKHGRRQLALHQRAQQAFPLGRRQPLPRPQQERAVRARSGL
ncbi:hypothetical protein PMAYCL1PPCAC_04431, partial [Pristionchus mayeri]